MESRKLHKGVISYAYFLSYKKKKLADKACQTLQ